MLGYGRMGWGCMGQGLQRNGTSGKIYRKDLAREIMEAAGHRI